MNQRSTWLVVGLSACCACDGVGRALVNYQPPSSSETLLCSTMRCEGVLPVLTVPDTPAEYGDLGSCRAPTDATSDGMPFENCRCQSLELDLSAESALPFLVFGPGSFENCRLRLRSERPFEIVWVASRLENVHIVLEGPIALSLRGDSVLSRVSLSASSEGSSLSFDDCDVSLFSLHDATRPMPVVHASLTSFASTLLETDMARLEGVTLRGSTLTAKSLHADDLTAQHARLEVGQSVISASDLEQVELVKCSHLKIVGGQSSTLEATCSERIDLHNTRVQQSVLNGPVECDEAQVLNTSFGLSKLTSLVAYESEFTNVNLCAQVRDARFQSGLGSCIDCQGPLVTGEALLCGESTFLSAGSENPCPRVASLQACLSIPDRSRPQ